LRGRFEPSKYSSRQNFLISNLDTECFLE